MHYGRIPQNGDISPTLRERVFVLRKEFRTMPGLETKGKFMRDEIMLHRDRA